ncbi:unnamed protein product [Allacma fusca]|uniref:Uncharacterized protein n=1 Tax=Allacma fusca TaxID=39272 RepID=A0A8J2M157_9HEXA|nr:unnamed protein product [Allacma fusca]
MKLFIPFILTLFCASVAYGGNCPLNVPITSSNLKCGDQVYHMFNKSMTAFNKCTDGKNGAELTLTDIICTFDNMDLIDGTSSDKAALVEKFKRAFYQHYKALSKATGVCYKALKNEATPEDTVDCALQAYEKVCGHKTCDWFNTVD